MSTNNSTGTPDLTDLNGEIENITPDINIEGDPQEKAPVKNVGHDILSKVVAPAIEPAEFDDRAAMSDVKIEDYAGYMHNGQVYEGVGLDDVRAMNQGAGEKLRRGLGKMVVTAGTAFAEPFVDLTYGLIEAGVKGADRGDFEMNDIFNNSISSAMDDLNAHLSEQYAHYYTSGEQKKSAVASMGTMNFWSDKFLNGAGFAIGAIASGMVSGGLGMGTKAAKTYTTVRGLSKEALRGSKAVKAGTDATKIINQANKLGKSVDSIFSSLVGAVGESGMEARGIYDNTLEVMKNERLLGSESYKDMDDAQLEDLARSASNVGFGINMMLVGGSNLVQFGKLFAGKFDDAVAGVNKIKKVKGAKGADVLFETRKGKWGKALNFKDYAVAALKNPLTEAMQEGGQYATETGIEHYMKESFDPEASVFLDDLLQATIHGMGESLGTKEGQESMILGALLGGIGAPGMGSGMRSDIKAVTAKRKATQKLVDELNKYKNSERVQDLYKAYVAHVALEKKKGEALKNGDAHSFNSAEFMQFRNYVANRIKAGQFDSLIQEIGEMSEVESSEFEGLFGMEMESESLKTLTDDLTAQAQQVKQVYDDVEYAFGNKNAIIKAVAFETSAQQAYIDNRSKTLADKIAEHSDGAISIDTAIELSEEMEKQEYDKEKENTDTVHLEPYRNLIHDQVQDWAKKASPAKKKIVDELLKEYAALSEQREAYIDLVNQLETQEGEMKILEDYKEVQRKAEQAKQDLRDQAKKKPQSAQETKEEFWNEHLRDVEGSEDGAVESDILEFKVVKRDKEGNVLSEQVKHLKFKDKNTLEDVNNPGQEVKFTKKLAEEFVQSRTSEQFDMFKSNTILVKSIESVISAKEFLLNSKQGDKSLLEQELLDLLIELEGLQRKSKSGARIPIDKQGVRIPVKQLAAYYTELHAKMMELEEHTAILEQDQKDLQRELEILYAQMEQTSETAKTEDAQESFIDQMDMSALLAQRSALLEALDNNRDTLNTVKSFADRIKAVLSNISNAIKGWFKLLKSADLSNREKVAEIKESILQGKKTLKDFSSKPENAAALKLAELYDSKEFKILERMLREGKLEQLSKYAPLLEEFAFLLEDQSLSTAIGAQALFDLRDLSAQLKAFARATDSINESIYSQVIEQLEFQAESFKSGTVTHSSTTTFKGTSTEGEVGFDTKTSSRVHLSKAFVTTTGLHTKKDKDGKFTDELTDDMDQRRWFKFTDAYNVESKSVKLKAITRKSNPYGDKVKFLADQTAGLEGNDRLDAEQIILVAVDAKTGEPILMDGSMIFTSMRGPAMVHQKDGVDIEDSEGNKVYKYSVKGMEKKAISIEVLNHKKARKSAIDMAEMSNKDEDHHLYFSITGKTPGVAVKIGEPTSVVGKLVDSVQDIPDMQVGVAFMGPKQAEAYEQENGEKPIFTTINTEGVEVRVRIGTPYVKHNGRVVELEARNLGETEIDTIFNLLRLASKQYNLHQAHPTKYPHETIKAIPGLEGTDIFSAINSMIVFDQSENKKYGIYFKYGTLFFAKGDGTFIQMSPNELVNQSNPVKVQLLKEFLATKKHHVNSYILNKSEEPYTSFEMDSKFEVSNEKVWSSAKGGYKSYLLSPEGREANEGAIPMKTSIAPQTKEDAAGAPQFLSTNLIFDTGIVKVKSKKTKSKNNTDKSSDTAQQGSSDTTTDSAEDDQYNGDPIDPNIDSVEKYQAELARRKAKKKKSAPDPDGEFTGEVQEEDDVAETAGIDEDVEEQAAEEAQGEDTSAATDEDDGMFRLPSEESSKEELADIKKERAWFQERFPNIPFEVVKDLIDGKAMGKFMIYGKVLVSELATKGTTYHEAWHVVSNLYLSQDQINAVYKEFRSTKGQAKTYEGVTKDIKDFTNKEVEEALAEEFRHYMINGKFSGVLSPKKKNFFQRLKDFLMRILWGDTTIEHVFDKIKSNGYKNARVKNKIGRANFYSTALPGKSIKYTREVMSNLDVMIFNSLFIDGTALDQFYGELEGEDFQKYYQTYFDKYVKDKPGKEDVVENWQAVKQMHLKQLERYGFQFDQDSTIDEATGEDQESNAIKDTAFGKTAIEQSTIKSMPKAVEMLLRTLPSRTVAKKGPHLLTRGKKFKFGQSADFGQTTNNLHNLLSGSNSLSEMMELLYNARHTHPEYVDLLKRLYVKKADKDGAMLDIDVESLSTNQHRIQTEFFKQFSKTKNDYLMSIAKEDGTVYSFDSTTQGVEKKLRQEFKSHLRSQVGQANSVVTLSKGKLQIDPEKVITVQGKRLSLKSVTENVSLPNSKDFWADVLEKVGVRFTDRSSLDENFVQQAKLFVGELAHTKELVSDLYADVDSGSQMKYFFEQEMNAREDYELSHRNPSGNTVYGISEHSYLSKIADAIKMEKIPEHLNNPFSSGSRILKRIYSGLGLSKFGIQIIEGLEADGKSGQGDIASKLKSPDYLTINVNAILSGVIPFLRTSDKSTEYGINFSEVLPKTDQEFINALSGYLVDELQSLQDFRKKGVGKEFKTYAQNGGELRFFKDIMQGISISPVSSGRIKPEAFVKKNQAKINAAIKVWLEKETSEMIELLEDQGLFSQEANEFTGFDPKYLPSDVKTAKFLQPHHYSQIAARIVRNSTVGYIEQTKLFTGDVAFFNDLFKRTAGLSGTKTSPSVDERTNKWLSKNRKRKDGKKPDGKLNVIVRDDVKVKSDYYDALVKTLGGKSRAAAYLNMEEGDAQGVMSFDEYREFKDRLGEWSQDMEDLYQNKIKGGTKALSRKEMMMFPPIKPMYYGPQKADGLYAPLYLKLSLMPLVPSIVKGKNLEKLAEDMADNKVGIHIFSSGTKVGAKGTSVKAEKRGEHKVQLDSFYNQDGSMSKITPGHISQIDYKYFGTQVEVAPKVKKKIKFGTQLRKLIASNLFENGVIKSITTKDGKLTDAQTQELFDEYNDTIDQLIAIDFTELLDKLKLKETENGFTLDREDFQAFKEVLIEELTTRELNFNIIDGLDLAFDSDEKLFDTLINKNQIESVLFSMVQNNVIRQKISGDMKVQVASTGFEWKRDDIKTSNDLKFYSNDGGITTRAEVKVPIPQALIPWMIQHYGNLESLNNAIANGIVKDELKELLNLTGFRIPTQGYNSMEAMVIKEFLPAEGGPMIIVPTEIVAKTGSDFDIDKLNVLINNFKIEDGKIVYPSSAKSVLQNRLMDILDTFILAPENFQQLVTPNTTDLLTEQVDNVRELTGTKPLSSSNTDAMTLRHNFKVAQYFWSGKAGVGMTANSLVQHVLSQISGLKLKAHNGTVAFKGFENLEEFELGATTDIDGKNSILDVLSNFVNAYVDIAADPFIFDLNAGVDMSGVYFFLTRIGVPIKTQTLFMTQPILVEYAKLMSTERSLIKTVKGEQSSRDKIVRDLIKKYGGKAREINTLSDSLLEKSLKGDMSTAERNRLQVSILQEFEKYSEYGDDLFELQQASSQDTKGVGRSRAHLKVINSKVDKVREKDNFIGFENLLSKTFLKGFQRVAQKTTGLYKEFFFTEMPELQEVLDVFFENLKDARISDSDFTAILSKAEDQLISMILTTTKVDGKTIAERTQELFLGKDSLAIRLGRRQSRGDNSNVLIDELLPVISATRSGEGMTQDNVRLFTQRIDAYTKDELADAFRELANGTKEDAKLADDILDLLLLQSGVGFSPITYLSIIPSEIYREKVNKYIDAFKGSGTDLKTIFVEQFYRNNTRNSKIVPYVKGSRTNRQTGFKEARLKTVKTKQGEKVQMVVSNGEYQSDFSIIRSTMFTGKHPVTKKPIYQSVTLKKIEETEKVSVYEAVGALGDNHLLLEYSLDPYAVSILDKNNVGVDTQAAETRRDEQALSQLGERAVRAITRRVLKGLEKGSTATGSSKSFVSKEQLAINLRALAKKKGAKYSHITQEWVNKDWQKFKKTGESFAKFVEDITNRIENC